MFSELLPIHLLVLQTAIERHSLSRLGLGFPGAPLDHLLKEEVAAIEKRLSIAFPKSSQYPGRASSSG